MFLLFGGDRYYPGGGMADFRGRFDTEDDAVKAAVSMEFEFGYATPMKCEWWHVVDTETWVIVRAGENEDYQCLDEINDHTAECLRRSEEFSNRVGGPRGKVS